MPKYRVIKLIDRSAIKYRETNPMAGIEHPRVHGATILGGQPEVERLETAARREEIYDGYEEMRETWPLSEASGSRSGTLQRLLSPLRRFMPGSRASKARRSHDE